jgi:hypothetical protein
MVSKKVAAVMIFLLVFGAAMGLYAGLAQGSKQGFKDGQATIDYDACGQHPDAVTNTTEAFADVETQFEGYEFDRSEKGNFFISPDGRMYVIADESSLIDFSTLKVGEKYNFLMKATTSGKFCVNGRLNFHIGGQVTYIWK